MQYILSYKSYEEVNTLMKMLQLEGFKLWHGLDNVFTLKSKIVGLCIDFEDKNVFQLNVTCMACWCNSQRKPLYVEEIIEKYDRLIIKKDYEFYNSLVSAKSKEDK